MRILNSSEIDDFCWNHRDNGVRGIRGAVNGQVVNIQFMDMKTGETIDIIYE